MQREPGRQGWLLGGRYRVQERLGSGGMADVFRAHDETLARDVAIKVFRTRSLAIESAADAERQRLELHALATLNHPNLITLFDGSIAAADGPPFLVMELVTGLTLADRIRASALPEPQVRQLAIQLADALAYVHARGMVHRDVKPANILLGAGDSPDSFPRPRLSDFGIVRLLDSERLTSVDATVGTASYLAPEQARGVDVEPVADVYSLGLVLLEALTGVRSFDGPPLQAVMARLVRAPEVPADLPEPWPGLLSAMTAMEPADRPTARQVGEILRGSASPTVVRTPPAALSAIPVVGLPEEATGEAPAEIFDVESEPARTHRLRWLVAAAVIAVLVGLGGVLVRLVQPDSADRAGRSVPSTSASPPASGSVSQNTQPSDGPQVVMQHTAAPYRPSSPATETDSTSKAPSASPPDSSSASSSSSAPSTAPASTPPTTAPVTSASPPSSSASPPSSSSAPVSSSTAPSRSSSSSTSAAD